MPDSLQIALQNNTDSDHVFAYITGIALQYGGQRCILKADGKGLYFPQDPPKLISPLAEDCAIRLGPPGHTVTVEIPQMAGGRVWVSRDRKLTFFLNPGPALVEPSVLNPGDPNVSVDFGFCEFTLNDAQLYANISYVDFVSRLPIAIHLRTENGPDQAVAGLAADGLDRLADALGRQAEADGWPWDKLVVWEDSRPLRILNATHADAVGASFDGYFEPYVEEVWAHLAGGRRLKINTQAAAGYLHAGVHDGDDGLLRVGDEVFAKPTTADILGCDSGPFTTGSSHTRNAIIPRLAAAFARSALLETDDHPSHPHTFYTRDPTNHYARLVHEHNLDGKGYAFAYDDVQPDGGDDQSGKVNAGDPVLFTVTVGGPR
ncbi:putative glucanase b [Rosellinia necatrix]|uniref:Putative glucanase b n=1 Tax=Rosellinia necatrix TaxID=77044 RepID=A0A1W2TFN8_ROSNE|nr:putative glucanase b [Rosellinia necatrix]